VCIEVLTSRRLSRCEDVVGVFDDVMVMLCAEGGRGCTCEDVSGFMTFEA
jgi:hypothetical protein